MLFYISDDTLAFSIHDIFHFYPHQYTHLAVPAIQTPATPLTQGVPARQYHFQPPAPISLGLPRATQPDGQRWASKPGSPGLVISPLHTLPVISSSFVLHFCFSPKSTDNARNTHKTGSSCPRRCPRGAAICLEPVATALGA